MIIKAFFFLITDLRNDTPASRKQNGGQCTGQMHCRPNMPTPPLIHFREFDQHLLSSARLYRLFCIPHHMVQTGQSFCCGVDARTLRLQHIHLKQPSRTPLCLCCLSPASSARCSHFRLQIPVVCLTAAVSVSLCCRLRSMLADSLY